MKKIRNITFVLLLGTLLVGCASRSSAPARQKVKVLRPAVVDLHGADVVSVLPIRTEDEGLDDFSQGVINVFDFLINGTVSEKQAAETAEAVQSDVQAYFRGSKHFTYIETDEVKASLAAGRKTPCQIYVTGYLEDFRTQCDAKTEERYDGKKETEYCRVASTTIVLQIIDAATNKELYRLSEYISAESSWYSFRFSVPSTAELLSKKIDTVASDFIISLQPHYVYVYE